MKQTKRLHAAAAIMLAVATTLGMLATTTTFVPVAHAVTQGELQQKRLNQANLQGQLAGVSQSLADQILELNDLTQNQIPAAQKELESSQQNAQQAQALVDATNQRLQAAQKDKADLEAQIAQSGEDYDDAQQAVAQLARDSFHGSDASTIMEVFTKSTTTNDFVNKMQSEAAVTRSEANAADSAANTLNKAVNRKQRLDAIETEIATLKKNADTQAATAQSALESAQQKQSDLQALRDKGTAARASLEQQKSSLTTQSAKEAADIITMQSEIDAMAQEVPSNATNADPGSGGAQQIPPSGGNTGGGNSGGGNSGGGSASGMDYAVPGGCPPGSTFCYGHNTGNIPGVGGGAYPALNCTLWAYIRRSQLNLPVGSYMGNGAQWAATGRSLGYLVNNTPHVGAVMVFAQGQKVTNWNADWQYGHVAVVERVNSDGSVLVSEGGTGFPTFPYSEIIYNAWSYQYVHY